jgi:diguanylate cyclase (GGDEF)-like protein/PAS domain S-box-containing protein
MNLTLKTKAALVSTLLVLTSVSVAGSWLYRQQARDHAALLRSQQNALAAAMAADVDFKLSANLALLQRAARGVTPDLLADPAAAARFLSRTALRPPFDGVGLVGPDGLVVQNDPPNPAAIGIGDRDYFRQARVTGQPTVSPPVLARPTGRPAVLMTVPLFDADHRFLGALAGGLDLMSDSVLGELARARIGQTGHYQIVTREAAPVYVVHPVAARLLQPAPVQGSGDDLDTDADFVTRQPLRVAPWELRIVIPAQEAHAQLMRARRGLVALLVLLGLGTALAVSAGLGWLMKPLETLGQSMRRQRESPDEAVGIDTSAGDERGLLAREFDALMRALRAQRAEMAAVSDTSPLGLFRVGLDGRLSYVNEAYLRIHGFAGRDEAADGWIGLLPEAEREEARRAWRKIVNEPVGMHVTRRLTRRDGRRILVAVRSAPIVIDGVVQGHVGTVADISERIEGERALRTLAAIFDATTDFVLQTDPKGQLLYLNPAARRLQGIGPDEPIGHLNALAFNPPETVARHAVEIVPQALEKGLWVGETLQWDHAHRELRVSHLLIAHRDRHGKLEYFSAVLRDITAQKAAQQALHRNEAVLRSVTELVPVAIAVVDRQLRCAFVNRAFEEWAGRTRAELLGRHAGEVLGAAELEARRPWIERALAGERVQFEREDDSSGHARHLRIDYIPLFGEDGRAEGFVAVTADISASRQEQRRLLDLAHTDGLTQVLNRSGFEHVLDTLATRAGAALVALLFIDLDRFKPVNDVHGHAVGDQLLQQFALRLRGLVRPGDPIARLGGDEFVIVLHGLHQEANAMMVAGKVVAAAGEPFELAGQPLLVGASVGVAFWRPGEEGWKDVLERADLMLYRAKAAGRGQVVIASGGH